MKSLKMIDAEQRAVSAGFIRIFEKQALLALRRRCLLSEGALFWCFDRLEADF
ncbi:hypothetical protein IZU99_06120 [Oscillospiraceae bacterium CM]|nr:hypothetical protein IZU99_06120 [Oscillospiraceae bacterium CM]